MNVSDALPWDEFAVLVRVTIEGSACIPRAYQINKKRFAPMRGD